MLRALMIAKTGIAVRLLLIVAAAMLGAPAPHLSGSESGLPELSPLPTAYPGPADQPTMTPQPEAYAPPAWPEGGMDRANDSGDSPFSARSTGSLLVVWASFLSASGLLLVALFSSIGRAIPRSGDRLTAHEVDQPPGSSHDLV